MSDSKCNSEYLDEITTIDNVLKLHQLGVRTCVYIKVFRHWSIGVFHGISTTFTLTISKSHENSWVCRSCLHKIIHNTSFLNFINKYVYPSIIHTLVLYETAKLKFYRKWHMQKFFELCVTVLTIYIYSDCPWSGLQRAMGF